ncbi:hypothetical protein AAF712_016844, partial [Marasmius tenuissimus]
LMLSVPNLSTRARVMIRDSERELAGNRHCIAREEVFVEIEGYCKQLLNIEEYHCRR